MSFHSLSHCLTLYALNSLFLDKILRLYFNLLCTRLSPLIHFLNCSSDMLIALWKSFSKHTCSNFVPSQSALYERGEVGLLFKKLLELRLQKADWDGTKFEQVCLENDFHKAMSISEEQFKKWINGESLVQSKLKYNLNILSRNKEFKAYKVKQWLNEWNDIDFSEDEMRKQPQPFYFMFKMDARLLKRLADVHRRKTDKSAVQRTHNETRSEEIHNYIHGGFPWSTISNDQRESEDYKDLKMPGMLPTAIIANILGPN